MESGCDNAVFFLFPSPPSLAGVNSFMVYMAYKDLYQVSNTEVMIHCCAAWGIWMGFLLLLMTLTPSTRVSVGAVGDRWARVLLAVHAPF